MKAKVVKATAAHVLENELNAALESLADYEIVDVKVGGGSTGTKEVFAVVILYK